jgi:hypothetical protein
MPLQENTGIALRRVRIPYYTLTLRKRFPLPSKTDKERKGKKLYVGVEWRDTRKNEYKNTDFTCQVPMLPKVK